MPRRIAGRSPQAVRTSRPSARRVAAARLGTAPGNVTLEAAADSASWRKSQPWRCADAAQEARARSAPGRRLAGNAAELEACLAGAHVALDHLRQDVPCVRRAGGAREDAVLDDRDRSRRAAEHEAVLGDAVQGCERRGRARRAARRPPGLLSTVVEEVEAGCSAVAGAPSPQPAAVTARAARSAAAVAGRERGSADAGCPVYGSTSRVRVADDVRWARYGLVLLGNPRPRLVTSPNVW